MLSEAETRTRTRWLILGAILVVGAVLRLLYITDEGFWFDELWIWRQMQMGLGELMHDMVENDVHPPLYELILYPWTRVFGTSELPLRLPSAIFGVGAIGAVYALGRRLFSNRVGLMAAGLVAVNEYAVYYSQEARSYSLLLLMSTLTVWAWWRMLEDGSRRAAIVYIVLGVLMAYVHVFGVLLLIYLLLAWLALLRSNMAGELQPRRWLLVHVTMGLLYLPWIPAFLYQASRVQDGFWIPEPSVFFWGPYFSKYTGHKVLAAIGAALVVYLLWRLWARGIDSRDRVSDRPSSRARVLFLIGWFVVLLGVPYLISIISQPMMHAKSAISVIAPIALVLALAVWQLPRWTRWALVVVWVGGSLGSIIWTNYLAQNREAWREMTSYVEAERDPDDIVVLYHPDYDYMYCYHYYLDDEIDPVEMVCEGEECGEPVREIARRSAERQSDTVWLLKQRASERFPELLRKDWVSVEEIQFNNGVLERLKRRD